MVTKHLPIDVPISRGLILAKNHMVTKQHLRVLEDFESLILAKNHMVTKRIN